MRGIERITKGTRIDILNGYLIIASMHPNGIVWCDEYSIDDNGNERLVGIESRALTVQELQTEARMLDGCVHQFVWQERR